MWYGLLVMAVYILIRKLSETDFEAVYDYFPDTDENCFGRLLIRKVTGEIVRLIDCANDEKDFCYSRAARKVLDHQKKGEYPQTTAWAS